jgi:hypothetical protein
MTENNQSPQVQDGAFRELVEKGPSHSLGV